jgi:hypothetical protein
VRSPTPHCHVGGQSGRLKKMPTENATHENHHAAPAHQAAPAHHHATGTHEEERVHAEAAKAHPEEGHKATIAAHEHSSKQ